MNIFNSLGSNYDFLFSIHARFLKNDVLDLSNLENYLSNEYGGQSYLTYKGRDAIYFALKASKLPKGAKVAINGFTCYAVYKAVKDAGLLPVLLDIDENTLHFSAKKIGNDVSAVIIQNTLGIPCEIEEIAAHCKKNDIVLIEDLAHSVGVVYKNGHIAGSVGDFVTFSFSQDKLVDAVSGGALVIRNTQFEHFEMPARKNRSKTSEIKDRLYPMNAWEIRSLYPVFLGKVLHSIGKIFNMLPKPVEIGTDIYKPLPWQALLAKEQLIQITTAIEYRQKIAKIYAEKLGLEYKKGSVYLRYPFFTNERNKLAVFLKTKGIYVSDIWYDAPIAPKRYMNQIEYHGECPNSEKISQQIINLPTHKNISEKDATKIADLIKEFFNKSHSDPDVMSGEESLANASNTHSGEILR